MNKAEGQPGALTPIEEALPALLDTITPIAAVETVTLKEASGRVLRQRAQASANVPATPTSAMDGYAVRVDDLADTPVDLPVSQRIAAGQTGSSLDSGTAARIFTGATLPPGADAVVIQENCQNMDAGVRVLKEVAVGDNVRAAGEDIRTGQSLFEPGHRLRPQDLAVLATAGLVAVSVSRALRISLLTTGDELVTPGTSLKPGQIYNANVYSLHALLTALGAEVKDLGILPDDPGLTRAALADAATDSDCIISTGGVSVGEEDHVKAAVEALGSLDLWKLAIKPGKPFAAGMIDATRFFGLPGNPVSSFVTFVLLVRPCLFAMAGCRKLHPLSFRLHADFSREGGSDRQHYLRVSLARDAQGRAALNPFRNQSSGVSASLSAAEGLAIVPPHRSVQPGDLLEFIPFSELIY